MGINSSKLNLLKTVAAKVSNANKQQFNVNIKEASNIFQEYEQYKKQLASAEENGGTTESTSNTTFGSPAMSVTELQAKMADCEAEFNKYYAIINETKPNKSDSPTGENKDEKNKIKSKEFGGLMA